MLQPDDVGMPIELPQKYYFAEGALGISCILKCIKHFLDGNNIFSVLIDGLPNHSVGSLAQLLEDFEFAEDMRLHFLCHLFVNYISLNTTDYSLIP